jgi:hypothetical protein
MLKISKLQQLFVGTLASIILFLLGLAILAVSLYSANRQQAATIQQIFLPGSFSSSPAGN